MVHLNPVHLISMGRDVYGRIHRGDDNDDNNIDGDGDLACMRSSRWIVDCCAELNRSELRRVNNRAPMSSRAIDDCHPCTCACTCT